MERQTISPPGRPRPTSPYSWGTRVGNLVFTSGHTGGDASGKVPDDIGAQTRNCIEGCKAVLEAAGSGLQHVLKVTIFLTDIKEFAAMNEVYRASFPAGDLPARSTVEVSALARPDLRVEIEMTGCIP
ncbi:MAG TPA: RidA family protein [bacterium]|nr:RidA family protein [bacterium]